MVIPIFQIEASANKKWRIAASLYAQDVSAKPMQKQIDKVNS